MRSQCVRRPQSTPAASEQAPARPPQGAGGLGLPASAAVPILDPCRTCCAVVHELPEAEPAAIYPQGL